ncbi:MAG: hypothetical protein ABIS67_02195 [Candidatus Eisenbacteria bacterium]
MSNANQHPTRRRLWLPGLALLPLSLGIAVPADASHAAPARSSDRTPVVCEAAVQHPIVVRVEALDPVRRGGNVRLRLTSASRLGLAESEARIVSAGGATVVGRTRAGLGRMGPQRETSADFTVRVPEAGRQFLIQFRVEGEGPAGRIGRGAVYNILPDGPVAPARVVAGSAGRSIAEYPARRMP